MADEKKKPDLKARLNRTAIGAAPPPAPPPPSGGDAPAVHTAIPAPADFTPMAPPVPWSAETAAAPGMDIGTSGVTPTPSGDDIAVPEFIQEERRQRAADEARRAAEAAAAQSRAEAAARAAAAAANPFDAVTTGPSAQDVRIVFDEKQVSDEEVGRRRTGTFVGYGAVALVMLGAGYLVGQQMESRAEGQRAIAAVSDIERQVNAAGAVIATMKDKVDHAASAAGIQTEGPDAQGGNAPPPAAAHVDEDLTSWFSQQSPDPPFSADAYANRVGRLRPDIVTRLMKVQIGLQQAWNDLRRHQEATGRAVALIGASLANAQHARGEFDTMLVVFARGPADGPAVMGTLVATTPGANGALTIAPPIPPSNTRTLYTSGDISAPTTIGTVGIPISSRGGLAASAVRGLGQPWTDYVTRLRSLKSEVDQLVQDHRQLSEALSQHGSGG